MWGAERDAESVRAGGTEGGAKIERATDARRGKREQIVNGDGGAWADVWHLLVIGARSMPNGMLVFREGERYAKKHGKLKRSG